MSTSVEWEQLDRTKRALAACSFLPGHPDKRFARAIAKVPASDLTERQRANLARLAWRYRRQMPQDLVPSKDAVQAIVSGRLKPKADTVRIVSQRRTVPAAPPMPPLLRAMVKA